MARQGQFGRSATGASNLSSAIRSLVQQQQAQEEQVFMKAFYDGTAYNGSVPTMTDVIAFYERSAGLSGIDKNSTDWTAFEQKIGDANNFDVKRTYNSLITEFNASNGENYSDLIDFVTGRAMTSTDQGDLNTYQGSVQDITAAFLKYQGQALSRGEISAQEYQRITLDSLQVLDPGSEQYQSAMYDSLTYEWNAMSTIWGNRVKAGKASESQFAAWAKGFAQRVVTAGIKKKTELYSGIFATLASYGGGAGGGNSSPGAKRVKGTISSFSDLLTLSSSVTGVDLGKVTISDINDPDTSTLKKMIDNPEAMLLLADFIDQNPGFTSPILTELGITDGESLQTWVNKSVLSAKNDAEVVAANGGTDNTDLWQNVFLTNGNATGMDNFAYASYKWNKDVTNAKGNDLLISYYNSEWKKYLQAETDPNGGALKSIYGQLPSNLGTAANVALYQAEVLAAQGKGEPGAPTLSGVVNDTAIDWSTLGVSEDNAKSLQDGTAILAYDPKTGESTTVGKQIAEAATGALKQISFVNIGGKLVAYTISVAGQEVVDPKSGAVVARVYQKENGETLIVDSATGNVVTGVELLENGDKFSYGEGTPSVGDAAPLIDEVSLGLAGGLDNFSNPDIIRAAVNNFINAGTINALSPSEQDKAKAQIDVILQKANDIEANNLERISRPGDIQTKIKIATLRGQSEVLGAYQWFSDNADVVSFDASGKPTLDYAALREKEQAATPSNSGVQLGAGIGAILGAPLGPFGIAAGAAIGGLLGGSGRNIGMEFQAAMLKARTPEEVARDRALGMQMPQADSYLNRVNQASQSSNVFFRNLAQPTQVTDSAYPIARPGNVSVYTPPTPKAVVPVQANISIARTAFNPQDPEARRALIAAQQKIGPGASIPSGSVISRQTGKVAL